MNCASSCRRAALFAVLFALTTGVVQVAAQEPAPGPAPGVATKFFYADATQEGVISLFLDAPGGRVVYYERIGEQLKRLGATQSAPGRQTIFREATTWSCVRLVRRFFAQGTLPDGSQVKGDTDLRTRSCADRFDVVVPRSAATGSVVRVRVVDRWGIGGITPVLCIAPPKGSRSCDKFPFRRAVAVGTRRFRASARGRWRVELRVAGHSSRSAVQVGGGRAAAPPPNLLATGDSTMQGVDSFLASELGDSVRVRSEIQLGFGLSKTSRFRDFARQAVKRVKPTTTVYTAGGTEGATMPTPSGVSAKCCDERWVVEYARRVRSMMAIYGQGGHARVFWLTLPTPRSAAFVTAAVNAAILRAAKGVNYVTVVRMDTIFTPNGYAEVIRYRGRNVRVRGDDGLHLTVAGTAIAASVIAKAIRATPAPT